jgi:hypothetical protein
MPWNSSVVAFTGSLLGPLLLGIIVDHYRAVGLSFAAMMPAGTTSPIYQPIIVLADLCKTIILGTDALLTTSAPVCSVLFLHGLQIWYFRWCLANTSAGSVIASTVVPDTSSPTPHSDVEERASITGPHEDQEDMGFGQEERLCWGEERDEHDEEKAVHETKGSSGYLPFYRCRKMATVLGVDGQYLDEETFVIVVDTSGLRGHGNWSIIEFQATLSACYKWDHHEQGPSLEQQSLPRGKTSKTSYNSDHRLGYISVEDLGKVEEACQAVPVPDGPRLWEETLGWTEDVHTKLRSMGFLIHQQRGLVTGPKY